MAVKDRGYPWIVKWGFMLGSKDYYIQEQCDKAAAANAPKDAIHENSDSTWATTVDIANGPSRVTLGLEPLSPVHPTQLRGYDGEVIGKIQASGLDNYLYQIEFPSVYLAARWARLNMIGDLAKIVGASTELPLEGHQVMVEFLLHD